MNACKVAKEEGYRFAHGDAMLILCRFFTIFAKQIATVSAKHGPLGPSEMPGGENEVQRQNTRTMQIRFCTSVGDYPVSSRDGKLGLCRALTQAMCRSGNEIRTFMRVTAASTNAGTSSTK